MQHVDETTPASPELDDVHQHMGSPSLRCYDSPDKAVEMLWLDAICF